MVKHGVAHYLDARDDPVWRVSDGSVGEVVGGSHPVRVVRLTDYENHQALTITPRVSHRPSLAHLPGDFLHLRFLSHLARRSGPVLPQPPLKIYRFTV